MNSAESFSATYAEARACFLESAAGASTLEQFEYPVGGPDGEALFTDAAWFGAADAPNVLVLISGTHGVEGFCGSGAQTDLLRRGEMSHLPDNVALLMVHAINPYGFAWLRRVTHENVDLNRNWIDFGGELPDNIGYRQLSEAICPNDWSQRTLAEADLVLDAYAAAHGIAALNQAMSGGQYDFPEGIFYGGQSPTWSRETLTRILTTYLGTAARVSIIDYHSGIGPWGYAERISTAARDTPEFRRGSACYGGAMTSTADGSSDAANIAGDAMSAARRILSSREVTAIALEVGTLPRPIVRRALRADAWLHRHGDLGSQLGRTIKRQIRAAFYGDADDWKGMVAGQSLTAFRQAIAALAAAPTS